MVTICYAESTLVLPDITTSLTVVQYLVYIIYVLGTTRVLRILRLQRFFLANEDPVKRCFGEMMLNIAGIDSMREISIIL